MYKVESHNSMHYQYVLHTIYYAVSVNKRSWKLTMSWHPCKTLSSEIHFHDLGAIMQGGCDLKPTIIVLVCEITNNENLQEGVIGENCVGYFAAEQCCWYQVSVTWLDLPCFSWKVG